MYERVLSDARQRTSRIWDVDNERLDGIEGDLLIEKVLL
jgi:hypothetical protein